MCCTTGGRRADVRATAAFKYNRAHARSRPAQNAHFNLQAEYAGHQLHRAGVVATTATYAGFALELTDFRWRKQKDARTVFGDRYLQGINRYAHHRAAGNDFGGFFLDTTGQPHSFLIWGADPEMPVAGRDQWGAGDRGDALVERAPVDDGVGNGAAAGDILHQATNVHRQAATWHLALGQSVDQLLLGALGITYLKRTDLNASSLGLRRHQLDGVGLVFLNAHKDIFHAQYSGHDKYPLDDLLRSLEHQPMVCGQAGFAFDAIDDQDDRLSAAAPV